MSNNQRIRDRRRIMEYLESTKRATTSGISKATKIHWHRAVSILKQDLEPSGEVWRGKDQYWRSTHGALPRKSQEELVADLKSELERAIFDDAAPEWLMPFEKGIRMGMTLEEAWHFARRKFISLHPELAGLAPQETGVEP